MANNKPGTNNSLTSPQTGESRTLILLLAAMPLLAVLLLLSKRHKLK